MAARWFDEGARSVGSRFEGWSDDDGPAEIERHRAWIAAKLFQGIGVVVLLTFAVVLFDSW